MGEYIDFAKVGRQGDALSLEEVLDGQIAREFAIGVLHVQEVEHPSIRSSHVVFPNSEITLGRLTSNDVITYNSYSSRKHATVYSDLHQVYVKDLSSLNGTYLNGKLVDSIRQLQNGDVLELGSSKVTFKRL